MAQHLHRLVRAALAITLALLVALSATARVGAGAAQADISPQALAQIDALIRDKEARTATQQKLDSQLIYELRMRAGQPAAPGIPVLETDVPYAPDGHTVLDVKARVTLELLASLRGLGAEILASTDESVRMHLDLSAVEAAAALPDVQFIGPRQDAMTTGMALGSRASTAAEWIQARGERRTQRAVALAAFLRAAPGAAQSASAGTGVGSQSSEGDVAHRANIARSAFGVNGSGIKIGVLSDGVRNLAASQALGDLGAVTVIGAAAPCPVVNTCDEGTAMLEIVHDLAPGAELYFASAFVNIATFASNIRALRAAGCDIIVDDVFYFVETPFQDGQAPSVISPTNGGVVIQAVKDVTADGALYFSSAGNSGNVNDGTGGVWEGDFSDGGATGTPLGVGRLHNFGGQTFNILTAAATNAPISLFWSDPLGGSSNDYDLFRLNSTGTTVVASSTNPQNGTQDPIEQITQSVTSPRIVIVKSTAAQPRFLHLETNRGRLSIATAGTTHGHAAVDAIGAYGVAATPAASAFPNGFTPASSVETFSSDGPRRIFFDAAGTAITADNFLAATGGGKVLAKPDVTAADGVSVTGVGGFATPFFGTSAAAPHAAAIAALLKSANPQLTQAQVRQALTATAIDIEAPGADRDSGAGIVMPVAALHSAGVPGTAFVQLGTVTANENPGDANGTINAGEGALLTVALENVGGGDATGVSATLTSSTPDITITQPGGSPYANIAAVTGTATNIDPLLFTVASSAPCPQVASFNLSVTYAGGSTNLPFSLALGTKTISIDSTLDGAAPASAALFTGATGTQVGRVTRLSPASSCAAPKAFPGFGATTGTRQFDAFTFPTCATSQPTCVQVTLTNHALGTSPALFDVAYIPAFTPGSLASGYAGDPAASQIAGGPISFSFGLPGGGTPFAVAVSEVNPGLGVGANYSLQLTGACFGNCSAPNAVPIAKAKSVIIAADPLSCGADASIDDGSSDPDGDALTITQSPAGPYPIGTTSVRLTVVDPRGATSQATGSVTVVDSTAPAISCPAPITVATSPGQCSAAVLFAPSASDVCSPPVTITSVPASNSIFPVGTSTVTSTAMDAAGNAATCTLPITVVDREAPVVGALSASPRKLWPANGKMVAVKVAYDLTDNCGGSCVLSVTSNEPPPRRGKVTAPDWNVIDPHHVLLRAERDDKGRGRTYTITTTCTDAAGNKTVKTTAVVVLHSAPKKHHPTLQGHGRDDRDDWDDRDDRDDRKHDEKDRQKR